MKETSIKLLIEYKPQNHGALCVSLAPAGKRGTVRACVQEGGGRLKI